VAHVKADQPLTPSILDRLLDDAPDESQETVRSRSQVMQELRSSVRRDLEHLLNTRKRHGDTVTVDGELEQSLINYGLTDLTNFNVTSEEGRQQIVRAIQRAIRIFEPRFKTVRVQLLDNVEPLDRTLRFRVDALMHAEPAPEPIVFDSMLEPVSSGFKVNTSSR